MPLPFLVGAFASLKNGSKGKSSVKEAVKRHNGNLEKLRIKEEDCSCAMSALEGEELAALGKLGELCQVVEGIVNRPDFNQINVSAVKLVPFDAKAFAEAAADPMWFLRMHTAAEAWLLPTDTAISVSEDAKDVWADMEKAEKILNGKFNYYDSLQMLAENYTWSLSMVRGIFEKHLTAIAQLKEKNGKTDWNTFGDTQRLAYQSAVMLAEVIFEMCSQPIVNGEGDGLDNINTEQVNALIDKACQFCQSRGFDYDPKTYDVVLRGSAKDYFSYRYRLEDKLCLLLPLNREQVSPILEKLRMDANVKIRMNVTHMHSAHIIDRLRDVDIKSQRVLSPDKSVYYIDLI
ncbi:MAG: hypothetical protein IKN17_09885 [Ruminococcus sp.]|nr:hypothetical protein [Ruminococcus sp.]